MPTKLQLYNHQHRASSSIWYRNVRSPERTYNNCFPWHTRTSVLTMIQQQRGFLTTRLETLPGPKGEAWSHSPHRVRFPSKGGLETIGTADEEETRKTHRRTIK